MAVHYIFVSPQASPKFHIAMSNRNGFTNLLLNAMRVGRGNFSSDHCLDSNIILYATRKLVSMRDELKKQILVHDHELTDIPPENSGKTE